MRGFVWILLMGLFSTSVMAQSVKQYSAGGWSFPYLDLPTAKNWCSSNMDLSLGDAETSPEIICNPASDQKESWFFIRSGSAYLEVWIESSQNQGKLTDLSVSFFDEDLNALSCVKSPTTGFLKMASPHLELGKGYFVAVSGSPSNNGKTGFDLCLISGLSNDFFFGAIDLGLGENIELAPGELQMDFPTGEGLAVPCSQNEEFFHDVWYSFTAAGELAEVVLQTGLGNGLLNLPELAVFSKNQELIKCASQKGAWKNISIVLDALVPGEKYYVAINSPKRPDGFHNFKFGLKIQNFISNDHPKGAMQLDETTVGCFTGANFSTEGGTHEQDLDFQFCSGSSKSTKWFKFKALERSVRIQVQPNESNGRGMVRSTLVLFNSDFELVHCANSKDQDHKATLSLDANVGAWYYVAVDKMEDTDLDGEFELCIKQESVLSEGVSSLKELMESNKEQPEAVGVYSMLGSYLGSYSFAAFSELYFGREFASNVFIVHATFPSGKSKSFKWNNVTTFGSAN